MPCGRLESRCCRSPSKAGRSSSDAAGRGWTRRTPSGEFDRGDAAPQTFEHWQVTLPAAGSPGVVEAALVRKLGARHVEGVARRPGADAGFAYAVDSPGEPPAIYLSEPDAPPAERPA